MNNYKLKPLDPEICAIGAQHNIVQRSSWPQLPSAPQIEDMNPEGLSDCAPSLIETVQPHPVSEMVKSQSEGPKTQSHSLLSLRLLLSIHNSQHLAAGSGHQQQHLVC